MRSFDVCVRRQRENSRDFHGDTQSEIYAGVLAATTSVTLTCCRMMTACRVSQNMICSLTSQIEWPPDLVGEGEAQAADWSI